MAWEAVLVLAVALAASALTLVSGFGLGTLLLPAFALVFPLEVAVGATAVVHLANNLWKGGLLWRSADRGVVLRFGAPALLAAFAGAALLLLIPEEPWWTYRLGGEREVTPLGLVLGALVAAFALLELLPATKAWEVPARWLPAGGLLSGFFGGLSGHQGALRSAFLARTGLDARGFVATGTLCAVLVDVSRLAVYSGRFAGGAAGLSAAGGWWLVAGACLMAFAGAAVGLRLVGKATLGGVRAVVGVLLLLLGPAIALGLV